MPRFVSRQPAPIVAARADAHDSQQRSTPQLQRPLWLDDAFIGWATARSFWVLSATLMVLKAFDVAQTWL